MRDELQFAGLDASQYTAEFQKRGDDPVLVLKYSSEGKSHYPIERSSYPVRYWHKAAEIPLLEA